MLSICVPLFIIIWASWFTVVFPQPSIHWEEQCCWSTRPLHFSLYCRCPGISVSQITEKEMQLFWVGLSKRGKKMCDLQCHAYLWKADPIEIDKSHTNLSLVQYFCFWMPPIFLVWTATIWFLSVFLFLPAIRSSWHHLCLSPTKKTQTNKQKTTAQKEM